jgi:putative two-component system response regulator
MLSSANCPLNGAATVNALVVDDEPYVRDIISRWLTGTGYSCSQAANANAAWEHLQRHEVHLVTLDIAMPGWTGIDLLPDIKGSYPDTEVLMLTGRGEATTAIQALTSGASSYLIKPIQREELLFHARRALERRQLIVERRQYTQQLEDKVREQTAVIRHAHEETIHRLVSASMYRDEETGAHIRRTGLYSELIADVLGWSAADVEHLRLAAPMHDVGKLGVPDAVLCKPGKLTRDEFEIMKTHTSIGARILAGSDSPMLQMAEQIARCHHERWDGGGYPAGLAGAAIPEVARIVAIVDVYDALTHDRVYRPAMTEDEALAIIEQGRGTHFDPSLVSVFFGLLPEMRRIAHYHPDDDDERSRRVNSLVETRPATISQPFLPVMQRA